MAEQSIERGVLPGDALDGRTFAEVLAETTPALVCVYDRDGRILLFNEACEQATGFSADDVLGRDARDYVIPPEEVVAFGEVLAEVWATGLPSPQVGHWLTKAGDRRMIAWSNKPIAGEDGTPLYLVTTGLDITERELARAERRALEGDLQAKLIEVSRLAEEQAGLRRVATLVAAEATPEQVFDAISEESARVLEATASAVFRYEPNRTATVVGRFNRDGVGAFALGSTVPLDGHSAIARVHVSGEPTRVDNYDDMPGPVAETMRQIGYRCTVAAPIAVGGKTWGAVAVASADVDRLPPQSEARLGDFCELASLAVASAEAREELRASRARIVQAGDSERRRLERNLHDGAQQRLVSLSLALRMARAKLSSDPGAAEPLLAAASQEADLALEELRELARGLHPAILSERGLRPAIESLAERASVPVEVMVGSDARLPESIEAAAYYIVSEALANVAKHAQADIARVGVRVEAETLVVDVADDGCGGADPAAGSGLVGLRDRVDALGGILTVHSPQGGGTVVRARFPLATLRATAID